MWSILINNPCELEKNVDEVVNRCPLYPVNWWCSTMSLLIFCLLNLLISDRWVLKSPAIHILVDSSVSSCSSISSCCTYFDSVLLGAYTLRIGMSSWRTDSFSLCNVLFNPDNLHCFKVFFVWNYYSYSGFLLSCINIVYLSPSTYFQSICVFITWVSYRWNVLGSSFLINSDNLFYLVHLDHWHSTCLFM